MKKKDGILLLNNQAIVPKEAAHSLKFWTRLIKVRLNTFS